MPQPKQKKKVVLARDMGSLELTEEIIREHAYRLYEERGREDGHALEDWLRAEAEIMGRKASKAAA